LAVVTSAKAGEAVTAAKPPVASMAKPSPLARNFVPLRTRLGVSTEVFFSLILLCSPS
jgi:hypothetical protein